MNKDHLRSQQGSPWKELPSSTGVYLFKQEDGKVLYVGKAINLKNRVRSYYKDNTIDFKAKSLVENADKVEYIEANSELESLLLEARLIKEYRPKYNIRLKDDAGYLYVGISKEKYPRVYLMRRPENEEGLLDWFGPFPTSSSIREVLRIMRRIFPYRSCETISKRPCLYYHLGLCPGFCADKKVEGYDKTIKNIRLFLNGKVSFLLRDLNRQMEEAAKELKFEEAGSIKRKIVMIQGVLGSYKKLPDEVKSLKQLEALRKILVRHQGFDPLFIHRLEAYDVANLGPDITVGSMVVMTRGEPDNKFYRQFRIHYPLDDPAGIREMLSRRLGHAEWVLPQLILVDGGKGQLSSAFDALLESRLAGQIGLLGLAKKEEIIIVPKIKNRKISGWKTLSYSLSSPALNLLRQARDEAHRFAQRYYKKVHRRRIFGEAN